MCVCVCVKNYCGHQNRRILIKRIRWQNRNFCARCCKTWCSSKCSCTVAWVCVWDWFELFWLLASKEVWLSSKKICRGKVRPPQFRKQLKPHSEAKNESSKSRKIKQCTVSYMFVTGNFLFISFLGSLPCTETHSLKGWSSLDRVDFHILTLEASHDQPVISLL